MALIHRISPVINVRLLGTIGSPDLQKKIFIFAVQQIDFAFHPVKALLKFPGSVSKSRYLNVVHNVENIQ